MDNVTIRNMQRCAEDDTDYGGVEKRVIVWVFQSVRWRGTNTLGTHSIVLTLLSFPYSHSLWTPMTLAFSICSAEILKREKESHFLNHGPN